MLNGKFIVVLLLGGLIKKTLLKILKILCCGHMVLVILTDKKFLERFTKKDCRK